MTVTTQISPTILQKIKNAEETLVELSRTITITLTKLHQKVLDSNPNSIQIN